MAAEAQRTSLVCKVKSCFSRRKDAIRLFRWNIFYMWYDICDYRSLSGSYICNKSSRCWGGGGDNKVNVHSPSGKGEKKRHKKKKKESAPLFLCHNRSDIFIVYGGNEEWSVFCAGNKHGYNNPTNYSNCRKTSSRGIQLFFSSYRALGELRNSTQLFTHCWHNILWL